MSPHIKIQKAKDAAAKIDTDLWPVIAALQRVGRAGNGSGIYADVPAFRCALRDVFTAVARAKRIVQETDWPTEEDYDACQT